jgi:hypothetical protein
MFRAFFYFPSLHEPGFRRFAASNPGSVRRMSVTKKNTHPKMGTFLGDLTGNRTRIARMRTWRPNR